MNDNLFSQLDFGPLKEFLSDDNITDISYDNGGQIHLKTLDKGIYRVERPDINNALMEKLAFQCSNVMGKTFNMAHPFLDAESAELRLNFVHDSIATNGIACVIRKTPAKIRLNKEKLVFYDLDLYEYFKMNIDINQNIQYLFDIDYLNDNYIEFELYHEELENIKRNYQNLQTQPIQNIINTNGTQIDFEARILNENEKPDEILIQRKTAFIDLKNGVLSIKELNGEIKSYKIELPKTPEQLKIEELERKLKEYEQSNNTISNIEEQKSTSNDTKSSKK